MTNINDVVVQIRQAQETVKQFTDDTTIEINTFHFTCSISHKFIEIAVKDDEYHYELETGNIQMHTIFDADVSDDELTEFLETLYNKINLINFHNEGDEDEDAELIDSIDQLSPHYRHKALHKTRELLESIIREAKNEISNS